MRICEIFTDEGQWTEIEFKDIQEGDIFRLFDDGKEVRSKGILEFKATSSAYLSTNGQYVVLYEVVSENER